MRSCHVSDTIGEITVSLADLSCLEVHQALKLPDKLQAGCLHRPRLLCSFQPHAAGLDGAQAQVEQYQKAQPILLTDQEAVTPQGMRCNADSHL